jgi:uncharacterized repeat protein (TIGR03833 family)
MATIDDLQYQIRLLEERVKALEDLIYVDPGTDPGSQNNNEVVYPETCPTRDQLAPGMTVVVVEKQNQPTGAESTGVIARILTHYNFHPHGIKVMFTDGRVGRVKRIAG